MEARKGHSLEVGGSSPSPAITSVLVIADVYKHIFITLERVHGPWIRPFSLGFIAQLVEQLAVNQSVAGSSPAGSLQECSSIGRATVSKTVC